MRDVHDIRQVMAWADRFNVPLVARSGGHGYTGNSTSRRAVVVDLGHLTGISLHSDGTVALGPAARLGNIYPALARHGIPFPAARVRRSRSADSCSAAAWAWPGGRWG